MYMAARCLPVILLILAAAPPVLAETYKWVDEKGVVNYSNTPPPAKFAKQQLIEQQRVSVVPHDPTLAAAIAAMDARAARQQAYDEAEYARRQGYMLAALDRTPARAYDCPYRADCSTGYAPDYYYPYGYAGTLFIARAARGFPHAAPHRVSFRSGGRGAPHAGGRGGSR
jgi:hypothetical protein